MRKNLLFCLLALITSSFLRAQIYYKMLGDTNKWFVSGEGAGVKASPSSMSYGYPCISNYIANKDSVFNAKTYKIFKTLSPMMCLFFDPAPVLIREDTIARKIYLIPRDSTNELLVIDFSMNVGDSIYLPFSPSNYLLKKGYYKLDSVVTMAETIGPRKHFFLSRHNADINPNTGKKYFIEWIESIGATHFPINLMQEFGSATGFEAYCKKNQYCSFITCKTSDGEKYYQDSCVFKNTVNIPSEALFFFSSCEIFIFHIGGINEKENTKLVQVYPNPVKDLLFIKSESGKIPESTISIYNSMGQMIYHNEFENVDEKFEIDTRNFPEGIYIFQIKNREGYSRLKFVKN